MQRGLGSHLLDANHPAGLETIYYKRLFIRDFFSPDKRVGLSLALAGSKRTLMESKCLNYAKQFFKVLNC